MLRPARPQGTAYWLVSVFDKTVPADEGGLLLVLVGAGGAGYGVWAFDEFFPLAGNHASDWHNHESAVCPDSSTGIRQKRDFPF